MLKIIAATDFSEAAKHALRFIVNATRNMDREILVLNVVHLDGPPPSAMMSSIIESLKTKAYFDYQTLSAEISAEFGEEIPMRFHAEVGHPASRIIQRYAAAEGADLIVMGMKGLSGVEKAFLGSVAANVAMHSRFPVMIVPANCQIYPIEHIVDATDLYQDEIEFGAVMQFARLFGAEVSMLHVFASDDAVEQTNIQALNEGLVKKYGELKDVRYVSVKNDNVVNGIEAYTNEHPTDLLVVFTHKRLFYERLFDRSISRELAFESKVALLVLKSE
ncbi:MAG: universal stress protein [Chitinophagales bacterium]|nr:hypothetical protein [Bacteroidota bacterium]